MIFLQITKGKNEPVELAHEGAGEATHRGGSLTGRETPMKTRTYSSPPSDLQKLKRVSVPASARMGHSERAPCPAWSERPVCLGSRASLWKGSRVVTAPVLPHPPLHRRQARGGHTDARDSLVTKTCVLVTGAQRAGGPESRVSGFRQRG